MRVHLFAHLITAADLMVLGELCLKNVYSAAAHYRSRLVAAWEECQRECVFF